MADLHASAEYRRRVATSLALRAVSEATEDARKAVGCVEPPGLAFGEPEDRLSKTHQMPSRELPPDMMGFADAQPILRVNGQTYPLDVEPRMTLLDCLR